jgi:hypothetical protein
MTAPALDDAPGLDWQAEHDGTLVCAVSWHGARGWLVLEPGGPGPATLSLVGAEGVLWTRPLEASRAR